MSSSILRTLLLCGSCFILSITASATPLTWTLSAFAAPPSGPRTVDGTFTYDADTNQLLNWDVDGFFGPGCQGGPPCGIHGGGVSADGMSATFSEEGSDMRFSLLLEFTAPLTDAGGTIQLVPGSCIICGGPGYLSHPDFSGSGELTEVLGVGNGGFNRIFGRVAAAPEPDFGSCTALFVLGLAGIQGYKRRRRNLVADE